MCRGQSEVWLESGFKLVLVSMSGQVGRSRLITENDTLTGPLTENDTLTGPLTENDTLTGPLITENDTLTGPWRWLLQRKSGSGG